MIFFSVIIPVYNRSHLLAETIQTVISQTYPNFEIIVVDDGSKEDIKKVIDDNFSNEKRIKYFYKQNEERGAARNFGIQKAIGDYAVFFDSDDFMKSHYLETLHKVIMEKPEIKLVAAKYNYDNNGKTENHPTLASLKEGWYDQALFLKGNILACNYAIKINGHSFKYFAPDRELASMEDWLFLLENLSDSKIFIKDEICITMRQHDERSMSNNQKVIEARRRATDWALNKLELSPSKKKTLIAWSHYFCGIHEYLDHKKSKSITEAFAAIKNDGLQKAFLLLLIKSVVGRNFVRTMRWTKMGIYSF